jgi:HemX protein
VDAVSERLLFALAVAFYAAATGYAVLLWRRGFKGDNWWCYILLACGFLPNTGALTARGFSLDQCPVTNLFEAMMFVCWAVVACHLIAGLLPRLRFLCALAAPVLFALGVFGLQPGLDKPGPTFDASVGIVSLHAALVLLAYGTFGLSAAAAVLYLVQEHDLKFHKVRAILSRLPSIERLEKVATSSLAVGLVLLSAGLLLTIVLLRQAEGVPLTADPKVAWSFLVWVMYAVLLATRLRRGWGQRPLAWATVGSFVFVMLTFWGTNLLSPLHH